RVLFRSRFGRDVRTPGAWFANPTSSARADEVGFANHAPGVRTFLPNLDIPLRNPNLHVVHIENDVVFRAILDDAIPRAAPQALAFRPITATARPPDVSHASLARERVSQLVA